MTARLTPLLALLLWLPSAYGADAIDTLQSRYRAEGAGPFTAEAGQALWTREFPAQGERPRSCTACHTDDIRAPGRHARTGKPIDPMAPSVNAERFTDTAKIEKWFTRNCKWTLGRACTAQEKGDVLSFVQTR